MFIVVAVIRVVIVVVDDDDDASCRVCAQALKSLVGATVQRPPGLTKAAPGLVGGVKPSTAPGATPKKNAARDIAARLAQQLSDTPQAPMTSPDKVII